MFSRRVQARTAIVFMHFFRPQTQLLHAGTSLHLLHSRPRVEH